MILTLSLLTFISMSSKFDHMKRKLLQEFYDDEGTNETELARACGVSKQVFNYRKDKDWIVWREGNRLFLENPDKPSPWLCYEVKEWET